MKMITAIIRPEKLDDVQEALSEQDVHLLTVTSVRGCGKQQGFTEFYRGKEIEERLIGRLKLEIAVNDSAVESTVDSIVRGARTGDTGRVGDGKIFVLPMDDCVRIRTGETGNQAIGL